MALFFLKSVADPKDQRTKLKLQILEKLPLLNLSQFNWMKMVCQSNESEDDQKAPKTNLSHSLFCLQTNQCTKRRMERTKCQVAQTTGNLWT